MSAEIKEHWIWERVENVSTSGFAATLVIVSFILAIVPLIAPTGYTVQYLFTIFLFMTMALGWNILSGFTGYVNFGYAGFIGLGAYAAVLPMHNFGVPWYGGLVSAAVVTAVAGVIVGYPTLRLSGAYFAIGMLALATAAGLLFTTSYLRPITEGTTGISFFSGLTTTEQYYLVSAVMLGTVVLTLWIATSPFGKRLLTIREDELLAASLGVNTVRDKLIAMALHSGVAGVCGALLAFNLSYIDPATVFDIQYTEYPIVMVLFGGLGTVTGPVVGGLVIGVLREFLWAEFPRFHLAILGALIVFLVLFLPEGVVEWLKENDYIPRRRWL